MTFEAHGLRRVLAAPVGLWARESNLTAMLSILVVTIFVVSPLAPVLGRTRVMIDAGLTLAVAAGVFAVARSRWAAWTAAVVVVVGQGVHWLLPLLTGRPTSVPDVAWRLLFVAALTVLVLRQVLGTGIVTAHRIRGAVAVYLLLGVLWTLVYHLIELLEPGSLHLARSASSPAELANELLYFSFATLTTVGYGDATAVLPAARSAAMLEALVGQLYPAILIARLVSLHLATREGH